MNESEIEIQATDIPEVIAETAVEEQEQPKSRRASLMAAVRSRAYNSDLTRAHVALMEREVLLPHKQLDLFRLVNRHYRTLQAWHDQFTGCSIQRALQYLEDMGGIQLVDGQTREWVEQTPDADVLYEFTDVTHSLVTALNPETLATVSARLNDTTASLESILLPGTAHITPDLVRAWRAILIGPALFRHDDPAA